MSQRQNRTTRKVVAQRKFAQGAAVLPQATAVTNGTLVTNDTPVTNSTPVTNGAPVPNGTPEQRGSASTTTKRNNIQSTSTPVHLMLDYLCFKNSHHHTQPIVLLERLPENMTTLPTSESRPCTRSVKAAIPKSTKNAHQAPTHTMCLRSSDRSFKPTTTKRGKPDSPKRRSNFYPADVKKVTNKRKINPPRRRISLFTIDDDRPLKYFANSTIKNKQKVDERPSTSKTTHTTEAATSTSKANNLKRSHNDRQATEPELLNSSDTVGFNITPSMNYYSEQGIHRWMDGYLSKPPVAKRPRLCSTERLETKKMDICSEEVGPGSYQESVQTAAKISQELETYISTSQSQIVTENTYRGEIDTNTQACETEPQRDLANADLIVPKSGTEDDVIRNTSLSFRNASADLSESESDDMSETIKLTYADSPPCVEAADDTGSCPQTYEMVAATAQICSPSRTSPQPSTAFNPKIKAVTSYAVTDETQSISHIYECCKPLKEEICPAQSWRTVSDVVCLSRALYNLRCNNCIHCRRIDKYKKICDLLKNKFNIDGEDTVPAALNSYTRCVGTDISINNDNVEVICMEMLPRHPHLMIRCELEKKGGRKVLYGHLILRTKAEPSIHFSFIDHEYIINKFLEALIINVDEPPRSGSIIAITMIEDKDALQPTKEPVAGPSGLQHRSSLSNFDDSDSDEHSGEILSAPTFRPTSDEFTDPLTYFETIRETASKYGICKIVLPSEFDPPCNLNDHIKFEVFNQYISRLYNRWGPASRELCAIKSCLKENKIGASPAVIDGVEVNLPRLYNLVQHHGGLQNVINKNKWAKVAEDMNLNKGPSTGKKLDQIYVTHLLPYNALTPKERQALCLRVQKEWHKRNEKMLQRAANPLHHQKLLLGETNTSSDESEDEDAKEVEDCVTLGQKMYLGKFKRVAKNAQCQFFKNKAIPPIQVEEEYWRMVMQGTDHVCVNTASIDTGEQGLGFPTNKNDFYSNHDWNLKMLSQNSKNILQSMGPVLGVTVPTLHLGMIFSSSCWHRDPHSLPWIEYQHSGPTKIWYSVPEKEEAKFRNASSILFPTSCQNKDLWLSSDISMIPPNLLAQQNVKVYRVMQNPGEYVLVMPRAYSSSICTGFTVSESVYFATESLLEGVIDAFKEIRESCEPSMFTLIQLLMAITEDQSRSPTMLKKIQPLLNEIFCNECNCRIKLQQMGVRVIKQSTELAEEPSTSKGKRSRRSETSGASAVFNVRDYDECEVCRCTLYLSKVKYTSKNMWLCPEHACKIIFNKRPPVRPEELEMIIMFNLQDMQHKINDLCGSFEQED